MAIKFEAVTLYKFHVYANYWSEDCKIHRTISGSFEEDSMETLIKKVNNYTLRIPSDFTICQGEVKTIINLVPKTMEV